MTSPQTQMRREVLEIPSAANRLLTHGADDIRRAADAIRARNPQFMVSVARGSSDHVATYLKYVSELLLGTPVASIGPSIASIYDRKLKLDGSVCLSVSQSGQSPDIVKMAAMARTCGALSIAITNHPDSPLARGADHTLHLHAGAEVSVAATKTFVNSTIAGVWLLAEYAQDETLLKAIYELPTLLEQAVQTDWPQAQVAFTDCPSIFCLGRGPAYAIANEAALKLKETCQIHAESYSSAEVLHGPVSIVNQGFPVLGFAAQDAAEPALADVADAVAAKGATVFATTGQVKTATSLHVTRTPHPLTDPITLIASFYAMVEQVSVARGINPDVPRHLKKVTETV